VISSKVIDLLKTFSKAEFKQFGLFVKSPFFNRESVIVRFYTILQKYYPNFDGKGFDKQKVHSNLYPGKVYSDAMIRNVLSGTLSLAENFLAITNYQKKIFDYNMSLLDELDFRRQQKLFERVEEETECLFADEKVKDENYYYKNFILENKKQNFKLNQKSSYSLDDKGLVKMTDHLTTFYLINLLKANTYIANANVNMFGFSYDPGLTELIENYLNNQADKYKDVTYIKYFYNAFKLAVTGREEYFYVLRDIIKNEFESLSKLDKKNIFTILTNYCYIKSNRGESKFTREQFNIYRENIEKGHYKGDLKFMTHLFYMNSTVTGLEAGELKWVENFINKYKNELDEKNRVNTYNFCCSLIYYHKKEFRKALETAALVKTDDLSYKHQLKSLYFKIYFDMNETELFYTHSDSYKHFISKEKFVSPSIQEAISNYLNFTKRLFDIKNNFEKKDFDFEELKKEVIANKSLINKLWILQKISEIEKGMFNL